MVEKMLLLGLLVKMRLI